jgi:predicted esterase
VYALNGEGANAVKWLRRSAENGFTEVTLASTDPDLAAIRKEPGYAEALKLIQENLDRERKNFERRAEKSKPRVIVPPDHEASKPAALIIVLHGYGGDADGMANAWRANAQEVGAVLVAPRAVRPAMEGGFDWGRVDEADILVTRAMEQVLKEYAIDTKRIVLCGFSQGGFMAYALAFRHPEKFCGVIPIAAGYDPGLLPASGARPDKMPNFYIIIGSEDRAFRGNLRASRDLEAAGIPVELRVQEGLRHRFPNDYEVEFRKALKFVLPP